MSNVLIGIIGVILFIGLALAGALFLGPRFQDATINSRAASEMQHVAQYANAIAMFQLQEGEKYSDSKKARLIPAYLKEEPITPGGIVQSGYDQVNGFVLMMLAGKTSDVNRRICESIQRTKTGSPTIPVVATAADLSDGGCMLLGDSYAVYQKV